MRGVRVGMTAALGALLGLLVLVAGGRPVSAHTELESTSPAADEVVVAPVAGVTLTFTGNVAVLTGGGIDALDGAGQVRVPVAVAQPEGGRVVATFDPPLADGPVTIRWAVGSSDGHVIDGTFAFSAGPTPTTTTAPTTTAAPPAPATVAAPAATTTAPPSTSPPTTTIAATTTVPSTVPSTTGTVGGEGGGGLSGWAIAAIVSGAALVAGAGAVAAVRYIPHR